MANDRDDRYTKPELRERIKDELMASDKGGKKGQWSARKSQLLVQEYERQGGGYTEGGKDDAQRSLERWTAQDWQTAAGDGDAREGDGTTHRYLPKAVWEQLTPTQREEAERAKAEASRRGDDRVAYSPAVQRAFAAAARDALPKRTVAELQEQARKLQIAGRSKMRKAELVAALREAMT